jgi:hypothetical protein
MGVTRARRQDRVDVTTVNYTAVRRAQRLVGDQLEAERLERIRVRDTANRQRRYGPHTDDTAPTTVTVYGAGRYPVEEERPIHAALLEQRQRINDIAWAKEKAA